MGKLVGISLVLGGVAGCLYSWLCIQKEKQMRLEEVIVFVHKSIFAMQTEKVRVIDFFAKYKGEMVLEKSLHEIAKRLAKNTYSKGQDAWEEVLKEEEQNFHFDQDTFGVLLQVGNGFFGRSRDENICFLHKSLKELERRREKINERDAQERKVWVPVGMLGAVMIMILFI